MNPHVLQVHMPPSASSEGRNSLRCAGEATLSGEGSPKPEPTWIFLLGRPMGFPEAKLEMGLGKLCHWTNQHRLQKGMMGQSMFL